MTKINGVRIFRGQPTKKSLIALTLVVILAGTILINPALFNLQASPPNYQPQGPTFYSFFDGDTMETELYLTSYAGQTSQTLPDPIIIASARMIPVASRAHCREASFPAVLQNHPAAYRARALAITKVKPPLALTKFKLSADYVGHYTCFKIRMSDQSGSLRSYFQASIRQIAKPSLIFDYSFYQDSPEDKITAKLQLQSYNGQSSQFMPADALADIVHRKKVRSKAGCADFVNSSNFASINPRPLIELISPGNTVLIDPSAMQSLRFCYKILLDPDGDGKNWYTYRYTAPKIPHYSLSETPPQKLDMRELLQLFKRHLTTEGLEVVENVEVIPHPNGCVFYDTPNNGCWVAKTKTVYINDYFFPDRYGNYTYIGRIIAVQKALSVLTHEFFHAAGDSPGGLIATMRRCHFSVNLANYYERLPAATEACLHNDPRWGTVTATLKEFYETYDDKLLLPQIYRFPEKSELFSANWYVEFYASLPTYDIDLPAVLEDHYNLYLQDRRNFAGSITEDIPLSIRLLEENMRAN